MIFFPVLLVEILERDVHGDSLPGAESHQIFGFHPIRAEGFDRPPAQRQPPVRNDQVQIHADGPAETPALRARAERAVEGKKVGCGRGKRKARIAVGAAEVRAETFHRVGQNDDRGVAVPGMEGGGEGIRDAFPGRAPPGKPVHDHEDLPPAVFRRRVADLLELHCAASDVEPQKTGSHQATDPVPRIVRQERECDQNAAPVRQFLQAPVDALRRIPRDRAVALRAMQNRQPGIEELQMVVDFGDGAHGGA